MIKRKIVMGLLVVGTIGGFAAGFKSMRCHHRERRAAFEDHVADVCVKAAKRSDSESASAPKGQPRGGQQAGASQGER